MDSLSDIDILNNIFSPKYGRRVWTTDNILNILKIARKEEIKRLIEESENIKGNNKLKLLLQGWLDYQLQKGD